MERTRIKLCGLGSVRDIECANRLKPDYIGYVFAKKSKRYIDMEKAIELTKLLCEDIIPVGVFKNNPIEEVIEIAQSGAIRGIQLHGREDEEYIQRLRDKLNLYIIKSYGVAYESDIEEAMCSAADMVLLDTPGGGTGFEFDHDLLSGMKREYILAGGLTPETVGEYVKSYKPYGVDVSTGIESYGVKDPKKMEAFVKAVREGESR